MLTSELIRKLTGITEDQLRSAIRRGHLHPQRLSNGLFIWSPKAVKKAEEFFAGKYATNGKLHAKSTSSERSN